MSEQFYPNHEPDQHFHKVIPLHSSSELEWEQLVRLAPFLPRGWYELAALPVEDRIEFTREFWLSKLLLLSEKGVHLERKLDEFFINLEDIGIFLTQLNPSSFFEVHMVYSLKDAAGFFHGNPGATDDKIANLVQKFEGIIFPPDYLAFLAIHDGFCKYTDTGLIQTRDMGNVYQRLQHLLADELLLNSLGEVINPASLIPFYESFGLHCYQCFYMDWHPQEEIGNLFFSEYERMISPIHDQKHLEENLAFPSFAQWLIFYLEDIWHL